MALVLTALAGGCSDGDDEAASTTSSTASFEQGAVTLELNIAATGLSTVATDVSLRSARGEGRAYCAATAAQELAPHEATLEAAADAEVRRRAEAAVTELRRAIDLCAGDAEAAAVNQAITTYNAAFARLRDRIDALG